MKLYIELYFNEYVDVAWAFIFVGYFQHKNVRRFFTLLICFILSISKMKLLRMSSFLHMSNCTNILCMGHMSLTLLLDKLTLSSKSNIEKFNTLSANVIAKIDNNMTPSPPSPTVIHSLELSSSPSYLEQNHKVNPTANQSQLIQLAHTFNKFYFNGKLH